MIWSSIKALRVIRVIHVPTHIGIITHKQGSEHERGWLVRPWVIRGRILGRTLFQLAVIRTRMAVRVVRVIGFM